MLRFRRLGLNGHRTTHIRLVSRRITRTRSEFVFRKHCQRHHDTTSNSTKSMGRSSPHIPALYHCWAGGVFLSQRLQQQPGTWVVPEPPFNLDLSHKEHISIRTRIVPPRVPIQHRRDGRHPPRPPGEAAPERRNRPNPASPPRRGAVCCAGAGRPERGGGQIRTSPSYTRS